MNKDMGSELRTFLNALQLEIKGTWTYIYAKVLILLYKKLSNPMEFCGIYLG